MARGGRGLDLRAVFSHPVFLGTFIVAVAGWFAAFIGQAVTEAKFKAADGAGSAVGEGWFGIFLQLFVIVGMLYALGTDSVGGLRFQLSIFIAIVTVFSVHGTNSGIYASTSYQLASGAGWLLLSIVNIVWLLFLTSEEDSFFLHFFNSTGASFSRAGGPSSRRPQRSSSALGISSNGNGPVSYQGGSYAGVGGNKQSSLHEGMSADLSGNQEEGRHSPNMGGTTGLLEGQQREQQGGLKARALYSYTASPDDPNEISFAKGETLDIIDNTGKWWQARKADGTSGIAPSNYMQLQ